MRTAAREAGIEIPTALDATAADAEGKGRWQTFVEWWSSGKGETRAVFLRKELVFAARQKSIREAATAAGLHIEDGDWDTKWARDRSLEGRARRRRWNRFKHWYSGTPIPQSVADISLLTVKALLTLAAKQRRQAPSDPINGPGPEASAVLEESKQLMPQEPEHMQRSTGGVEGEKRVSDMLEWSVSTDGGRLPRTDPVVPIENAKSCSGAGFSLPGECHASSAPGLIPWHAYAFAGVHSSCTDITFLCS